MFNDFSGFDAEGRPVKISVPPTLLISSIGVHADAGKAVSLDAKIAGDLVYVIGGTQEELGGSEYFALLGSVGNGAPALDAAAAKERYTRLAGAIGHELVASAFPVSHGGLLVALAKVAIAGGHGLDLTVTVPAGMRPDYFLFSESLGRFVVTVSPDHKRAFDQALGLDAVLLGRVAGSRLRITTGTLILDSEIRDLEKAYKAPFGGH
jgi:phosphoribosylformylglycinamidine synthase